MEREAGLEPVIFAVEARDPEPLDDTRELVTVKVDRGTYPAWFLFAAMKAIGREHIRIDDA
jgi:hypothetical protein